MEEHTPTHPEIETAVPRANRFEDFFENLIFQSRLLLLPMYVGLAAAMILYDLSFARKFWELCHSFWGNEQEVLMLGVVGLLDATMVANLIVMTTIGGLSIFVREIDIKNYPALPRWMQRLTSGLLKVKMSCSLVGITGVHLLEAAFSKNLSWDELSKLIIIHLVFVISAYYFARIEQITHPAAAH